MLRRMLPWAIGVFVIGLLLTPFARDLYHRYEFNKELAQLTDPEAREAVKERYGSLAAYGDNLARRCEQIFGGKDPSCVRYRLSVRD